MHFAVNVTEFFNPEEGSTFFRNIDLYGVKIEKTALRKIQKF